MKLQKNKSRRCWLLFSSESAVFYLLQYYTSNNFLVIFWFCLQWDSHLGSYSLGDWDVNDENGSLENKFL